MSTRPASSSSVPFRASACLRGTCHDHAPSNLVTSTSAAPPFYALPGRGGEIYMTGAPSKHARWPHTGTHSGVVHDRVVEAFALTTQP